MHACSRRIGGATMRRRRERRTTPCPCTGSHDFFSRPSPERSRLAPSSIASRSVTEAPMPVARTPGPTDERTQRATMARRWTVAPVPCARNRRRCAITLRASASNAWRRVNATMSSGARPTVAIPAVDASTRSFPVVWPVSLVSGSIPVLGERPERHSAGVAGSSARSEMARAAGPRSGIDQDRCETSERRLRWTSR